MALFHIIQVIVYNIRFQLLVCYKAQCMQRQVHSDVKCRVLCLVIEPQQFIHTVWRVSWNSSTWLHVQNAVDIHFGTNVSVLCWRIKPHCPSWSVAAEKVSVSLIYLLVMCGIIIIVIIEVIITVVMSVSCIAFHVCFRGE